MGAIGSENDKSGAIGSGVQLILEELALATGKAVLADLDATRTALAAEKARVESLLAAAKELLAVDGGYGSQRYDAVRRFDARVALKRACGIPLSPVEEQAEEGQC